MSSACSASSPCSPCSPPSLVSWWSLLLTPEPPFTISELLLSLVVGSLLGLGGGCFRLWLESSSPPPTEWRDWDRTVKPWLGGGSRSCGAGIVIKPILKCFPEYAPSDAMATSSPILEGQWKCHFKPTIINQSSTFLPLTQLYIGPVSLVTNTVALSGNVRGVLDHKTISSLCRDKDGVMKVLVVLADLCSSEETMSRCSNFNLHPPFDTSVLLLPSLSSSFPLLRPAVIYPHSLFLDQSSAGQILRSSSYSTRKRRANSFLEEMLPGNLERECYEETCSQEEAKEIFQTQEKMLEFWFRYTNLNPCQFNPCMNGGICTLDRGEFLCLCPPQYRGKICESKRRRENDSELNVNTKTKKWHWADGGEEEGEAEEGEEEEDEGLLTRIVGGVLEKPGDYDKRRPDPSEQQIKIQRVFVHPHFHAFTFDSDIALVYLAKPVVRGPTAVPACLPDPHLSKYLVKDDNRGMVTGWGLTRFMGKSSRFLRKVALPVVSYKDCTMSTEQVITDNMFCAGYLDTSMDACSGDSGGPFVVNYRGTWFLTGIVSWGEKCAAKGKYGVYTRLGNFLSWIRDTMERQDLNSTSS
ncbi:hypothetical protein INR49_018560 [Caranx melampygus]|nr:hypothetical protein INR49_018560 [Caranx melampygus]